MSALFLVFGVLIAGAGFVGSGEDWDDAIVVLLYAIGGIITSIGVVGVGVWVGMYDARLDRSADR